MSPKTTSSCCREKLALLAAQAVPQRLAKNFRVTQRAFAAIRARVSSAPSAAVDVTAAAIIAVAVQTAVEDAPTIVVAVRNAAEADAPASVSSAVPAGQAVRVMTAGTREAMDITPALRAALNSFPKCSRLVRM